jgi:hypothetical protein
MLLGAPDADGLLKASGQTLAGSPVINSLSHLLHLISPILVFAHALVNC